MPHFSRVLGLAVAGLAVITSGCAVLNSSDADPRWANYQSWTKINQQPITGDHTGFLGGLHEAAQGFRQVYVNDIGLDVSLSSGPYQYPIGTVIAKEQYKNQAALDAGKTPGLTIAVKVSDNAANPADNWLWSRGYGKDAQQDTFCSGCHTIAMGNDFIFSNANSLTAFND